MSKVSQRPIPRPPFWIKQDKVSRFPCYVRPNAWRRFCLWAVLGWTVERDGK